MLGTLRGTAKRTLVLTGILIAAVGTSAAAGLMVQGAKVEGSVVKVNVANLAPESKSGTVTVVVLVNNSSVTVSAPFVVGPGASSIISLNAGDQVSGVSTLGIVEDTPTPF